MGALPKGTRQQGTTNNDDFHETEMNVIKIFFPSIV